MKTTSTGQKQKSKFRYVAKFYREREGIDYSQTFQSTNELESSRIFLAVAAREAFILRSTC